MNNTTIWGIIGLVVVGAGVGIYMSTNTSTPADSDNNPTSTPTAQENQTNPSDDTDSENLQAWRSAIEGQGSIVCEYEYEEQTGTAYADSGNVAVVGRNDNMTTHMVVVDGETYLWQEGESQGIMLEGNFFTELEDQPQFEVPETVREFESEIEAGNYDCEQRSVDASRFELPDNVEFQTMAELMQTGGQ